VDPVITTTVDTDALVLPTSSAHQQRTQAISTLNPFTSVEIVLCCRLEAAAVGFGGSERKPATLQALERWLSDIHIFKNDGVELLLTTLAA
jgi:hypothetical protein